MNGDSVDDYDRDEGDEILKMIESAAAAERDSDVALDTSTVQSRASAEHARRLKIRLDEEILEEDGRRSSSSQAFDDYYNISAVIGIAVGAVLFIVVGASKLNTN